MALADVTDTQPFPATMVAFTPGSRFALGPNCTIYD